MLTLYLDLQSQRLERISLLEDLLYLPAWQNRSVSAVSRYRRPAPAATSPGPARLVLRARPLAALVYHRQRQPAAARPHPCAVRKGGCAHICVPAYDGVGGKPRAHCVCRNGYRLVGHHDCERECLDVNLALFI